MVVTLWIVAFWRSVTSRDHEQKGSFLDWALYSSCIHPTLVTCFIKLLVWYRMCYDIIMLEMQCLVSEMSDVQMQLTFKQEFSTIKMLCHI